MSTEKKLTTNAGCPVADNQNGPTAGPQGPQLLQDVWFLEKLAHFDREVCTPRAPKTGHDGVKYAADARQWPLQNSFNGGLRVGAEIRVRAADVRKQRHLAATVAPPRPSTICRLVRLERQLYANLLSRVGCRLPCWRAKACC
jgi:Catalase